jgi:N-acyl homoserine lactone hydrolase
MSANANGPKRLYLMRLASGTVPAGEQTIEMSLGCYLVQMADGTNVLIDTGLPEGFELPAEMPPLRNEPNVVEQLAALGVKPDEVNIVISTHFDRDHVGFQEAFPNAEHVVQREQYEQARGGHPRFTGSRDHWDNPDLRYRLVDGDVELLPGLSLIATSGHAPGHQSVLVRLPASGPVLLAIDAVAFARAFTPERAASPLDDNEELLRASTQKLLDLVEREGISLVVFGHDGAQWETLKRAPKWYG